MVPEDDAPVNRDPTTTRLLWAVVAVGFAVRAWHVGWGLPRHYHPDEPGVLAHVSRMLHGDLVMHTYIHGPLQKYVIWLVATLLRPVGVSVSGDALYRLGRWLSVIVGTLAAPATFALARPVVRGRWALLAAAFVAVLPLSVTLSRYAVTDPWLGLFYTLSAAFAVRAATAPDWKVWSLGGLTLGLALGCKLSALGLGVPWAVALGYLGGREGWRAAARGTGASAGGLLLGLALGYPTLPWSLATFQHDVLGAASQAAVAGHQGTRLGPAEVGWLYYVRTVLAPVIGPIAGAAGVLGIGLSVRRHRPGDVVLLAATLPYLAVIESAYVVLPSPERYALPLAGPIAVWVALGTAALARAAAWRRRGIALAVVVVLAWPAVDTLGLALDLGTDTRDEATAWLRDHVTPDARIASFGLRAYLPSLPPRARTISLREDGRTRPDFVVLTSMSTDRWLRYPDQAPARTHLLQWVRSGTLLYAARPGWRTYQFNEPVIEVWRPPASRLPRSQGRRARQ